MALEELAEFQQKFATAMSHQDEALLSSLKHKMHLLMNMLSLQELEALLEQCQSLLQENAPPEQINEAQYKVEAMITRISDALKKYREELK